MFRHFNRTISSVLAVCLISSAFAAAAPTKAYADQYEDVPNFSYITAAYNDDGTQGLTGTQARELAQLFYRELPKNPDKIDVQNYYNGSNISAIFGVMYEVIANCDVGVLYKTGGKYGYYYQGNQQIEYVVPNCLVEENFDEVYSDIMTQLDEMVEPVQSDWSEAEKALYLHDYISINFDYDHTLAKHSVYEFLQETHDGVCDSYASLYSYLLNRVGVQCVKVSSKPNNHAWNIVQINGTWYYTDVTHDDSIHYGHPGLLSHKYFLNSGDDNVNIRNNSGTSSKTWTESDWKLYTGQVVMDTFNIGSTTVQGFWNDVDTAISPYQGNWVYTNWKATNSYEIDLMMYDRSANKAVKLATGSTQPWGYYLGDGSENFSTCCVVDDVIFFTTKTSIYGYYDRASNYVYGTTDDVYGIKTSGDKLLYYTSEDVLKQSTEHELDLDWCMSAVRPQYKVTFMNGSDVYNEAEVFKGTTVTAPAEPSADNYRFGGWYTDEAFTNLYDFGTPVTGDITLYAKMVSDHAKVTFHDGGNAYDTEVKIGETVVIPNEIDLEKDNAFFCGWYADEDFKTELDLEALITADTDVYAKFISFSVNEANITLSDNIKLTYRVKADPEFASKNAQIKFFIDDEQMAAFAFGSETLKDADSKIYEFPVEVAARQMSMIITGTITADGFDRALSVPDYSVDKCLETLKSDEASTPDQEKISNMVDSTAAFGDYARAYFENGSTPDIEDNETRAAIDNTTIAPPEYDKNAYNSGKSDDISGLTYEGSTLLLKSSTVVRHYFTVNQGSFDDYSFTVVGLDGVTLQKGEKENMEKVYYVDVLGIDPSQLGEKFTVTVSKGDDSQSIEYSPCCYMYSMYNKYSKDPTQTSFIGLLKAMFYYYNTALDYKA